MEEKIVYSKQPLSEVVNILSLKYMYKKVAIIGEIDDITTNFFKEYLNKFNISFHKNIDFKDVQEYEFIILFNYYNLNLIENISHFSISFLLIINNYLPYEIVALLTKNDFLCKIIINENNFIDNKSVVYCQSLIDNMYQIVSNFDDGLKNLLYETNYQYNDVDIPNICSTSLQEFDYKTIYKDRKINSFMESVSQTKNGDFAYKLLFSQVVLNLYKTFITYATPFNVDMKENYDFDNNKFWFIIKHLKEKILSNLIKVEYFVVSIKSNIIETNIDYYYQLCNDCKKIDIKNDLCEIGKTYNKNCLFKIIYQMGLIKFNV